MADFDKAAAYVKKQGRDGGPPASDQQKMDIYKYYKQATEGDVDREFSPAELEGKKDKVAAWKSMKGTSREEAKKRYVETLDAINPKWREE